MDLQIKENDDKEVGKINYGTNFNNFIKVRAGMSKRHNFLSYVKIAFMMILQKYPYYYYYHYYYQPTLTLYQAGVNILPRKEILILQKKNP